MCYKYLLRNRHKRIENSKISYTVEPRLTGVKTDRESFDFWQIIN